MKITILTTALISATASFLLVACESKQNVNSAPKSETHGTTALSNAAILRAIYGHSAGDSAVYDRGTLVESSSSDKEIVAKVMQKQTFQRHDSTLSLVITSNSFWWGAGVHSGWMDAALFHLKNNAWDLIKVRKQAVWGGSFGTCDCQAQMHEVQVEGSKKLLAFVRSYSIHQGEYEYFNVITEDLVSAADGFNTFATRNTEECAGSIDTDSLKTGLFVKRLPNADDKVELVSYVYKEQPNGKCKGEYNRRTFDYSELMRELRKPPVVIE